MTDRLTIRDLKKIYKRPKVLYEQIQSNSERLQGYANKHLLQKNGKLRKEYQKAQELLAQTMQDSEYRSILIQIRMKDNE